MPIYAAIQAVTDAQIRESNESVSMPDMLSAALWATSGAASDACGTGVLAERAVQFLAWRAKRTSRMATRTLALEMCAAPAPMIAILAKHQEFVMYVGGESLAPPAPVSQEVIQVQLQLGIVMPHTSEVVRNSWKSLKESKRLDL